MRVMIAAVACLVALVRADAASAAEGAGRALAGSICGEPSRLVELSAAPDSSGNPPARLQIAGTPDSSPLELAEEGVTLWCVSPDDPRCAPLENSAPGRMTLAQAKLGCAFDPSLALAPLSAAEVVGGSTEYRGSARDGVLGRLERPPR